MTEAARAEIIYTLWIMAGVGGPILLAWIVGMIWMEWTCRPKTPFDKEFKALHNGWYDGYIPTEIFQKHANALRRKYGIPERDYEKYPAGWGY